jgi:hypothetical protein
MSKMDLPRGFFCVSRKLLAKVDSECGASSTIEPCVLSTTTITAEHLPPADGAACMQS